MGHCYKHDREVTIYRSCPECLGEQMKLRKRLRPINQKNKRDIYGDGMGMFGDYIPDSPMIEYKPISKK